MTQAAPEAGVEVDPYDQEDADAVEAAIALAIAEALTHPPDAQQLNAHQAELIMESAVGVTLRFYAHRVLQLLISQWTASVPPRPTGTPLDRVYRKVQESVDTAVRAAVDQTGESVRDIIEAAAERARATTIVPPVPPEYLDQLVDRYGDTRLARADVVERGYNDPEAEALNRLRVGMEGVSRILTTRVREEAKFAYAVSMGAVGYAWRTRRDGRVRNSHGDLEGDYVRIGEPFITVNNVRLMRPGDPGAPLHETINCRCRLSYRMPAL